MTGRTLAIAPIALLAVLTATVDVHSAVPGAIVARPHGGPAPSQAGLVQRAAGRTVKTEGRVVPAADYFTKTPRETAVTLRSGRKTTLGSVMDSYARLDAALKAKGTSLDTIPKSRWANGAPPAGIQEATAFDGSANALVHFDPSKPHGQVSYPQGDPNRAQAIDYGNNHDYFVVTPYNHFNITAADPATQDGTSCTVSWNAGLKLYTKQFDIVKIVGSLTTGGSRLLNAKIQIYVLGNSEFAGDLGVEGDPPFDKAVSTSQLPGGEPSTDMDVIKDILHVHAVAGGSAYFKLVSVGDSGAVVSNGHDAGFYCSLDMKPMLRTEGHLRAEGAIGPTLDGMPALTVKARGSLVPLRFDLPAHAIVALHDSPTKISFGLGATLNIQLMAGKLDFTWQLPDICDPNNDCLVSDGLGIPTSGSIASWDRPAIVVGGPLVTVDPGLGAETLSSR